MADPLDDPDNRFYGATIEEVDAKIDAEGFATGMDVLGQVEKAYLWYLNGDSELADAQLTSLFDALRRSATTS